MTSDEARIGPAVKAREAEVVEVLAAAFDADVVYRQLLPDTRRRARALGALFRLVVADATQVGAVEVAAAAGGQVLGATVWLAPGAFPMSGARKVASLPGSLALLVAAPRSFVGLVRLGAGLETAHPSEPSWYLQALGVHPAAQRQGLGARLLECGLARADADGLPATLHTAVPAAAALYQRAGFRTVGDALCLVAGGAAHRLMRRPPATPPATAAVEGPWDPR